MNASNRTGARRAAPSHLRPAPFARFWYGATYYPEHWDEGVRAGDPERMAAAGFNVVRMAEFAWDMMEPSEGAYDFSFFDEVVARLGEKGIRTILCTPTATPPRRLTLAHPEMLRVDGAGVPLRHGSRQHCCYSNAMLRRHSRAITAAMAEHFADNGNVIGWQTDNEFHCEFIECHCEACEEGFRRFLSTRHGTVEALNRAWGTQFWSQTVRSWDEVLTPVGGRPTNVNPAQQLDYYRFLSLTLAEFQREQVDILRAARPEWFISHNGIFAHIDYRGAFGRDLDVLGYDSYPMFCADSKVRRFVHAYGLDQARAWTGNFIIPEQQSGPGGQAPNIQATPEPGEMRMMAYRGIARGADSLLFFRWRTCRFGAEEYWCGILDHDNVPRRRYDEAAALGRELARVGPAIMGTSVRVDAAVAAADMENAGAHRTFPIGLPTPDEAGRALHARLSEAGFAAGCVHPSDDLSRLRLYAIPHWVIIDPAWVPSLQRFVEDGGTLVIGARSATRDGNNNVIAETIPGALRRLAGVTVEEYGRQTAVAQQRPLSIVPCQADAGTQPIPCNTWYEVVRPKTAQTLFAWTGRHLDGMPAVTANVLGKGRVVYVGTYFDEAVAGALAPVLARMAMLSPLWPDAPAQVEVVVREGEGRRVWFFLNSSDGPATLATTPRGTDLVSGREAGCELILERYGVAVIEER